MTAQELGQMDTFTIKPLEWKHSELIPWVEAVTAFGAVQVLQNATGFWWRIGEEWSKRCASMADGKALAEAAYRERVMQMLEPVTKGASHE